MRAVAKGKLSFATMSCKEYFSLCNSEEANFMGFSHEYGIFGHHFLEQIENSMKLSFLQLSVMVAMGKKSFATKTHGCKDLIIDKIRSL